MAAKRGASGLSLVVAVNKPSGLSSHDVVNRCRRIFDERRVGHTGTLDPLATGVLPVCIGPATRLDRYLTGHDKTYRVTMRFGFETTTDDSQGAPTVEGAVHDDLLDGDFAPDYVSGLVGTHLQVPPQYSAVKVNGRKAYESARKGDEVALEPREVRVLESRLVAREMLDGALYWTIDFSVSKGTYIRALVRDMGRELGCPAHVSALERRQAGAVSLHDCVSLESLETLREQAAIDPVRLLGFRMLFGDAHGKAIESGGFLKLRDHELYEFSPLSEGLAACACTGTIVKSNAPATDGELLSVIVANRLKALYRYDSASHSLKPDCVFSTPISRM